MLLPFSPGAALPQTMCSRYYYCMIIVTIIVSIIITIIVIIIIISIRVSIVSTIISVRVYGLGSFCFQHGEDGTRIAWW